MTDGTARTKNRFAADVAVRWLDDGTLEVSSSKHTGWYTLGVGEHGQLACPCPAATYRPYRTCKHVWVAAEHLESHTPSTEGQRQFAQLTTSDRAREVLRHIQECEDGPYLDEPQPDDYGPGPGTPADAGGAQAPEELEQTVEPKGPATTGNPRLESLYD